MKKTLLLFLFLLLPFLGIAQTVGLSGDYYINSTTSINSFPTLSSALTKLEQVGFAGPVRFLIDVNQTTTSQYIINSYANSSSTNTLTIKPNTGKDITITCNNLNSNNGVPAVFMFNGASNVIIDGSNSTSTRNLTLINTNNISAAERAIIWIASNGTKGSSNITVKNSILKFTNRNDQLRLLTGVYSGSNKIGDKNSIGEEENTTNNSNITISNNEMVNVKDGFNIKGNSDSSKSPSGWKIQENKIGTTVAGEIPVRGMYISNLLNYEISGNTISGIRNDLNLSNDAAAIILLGNSSGSIANNKISEIVNAQFNNGFFTAGILVKSTGATTIYNNIISGVYNTTKDNNNYNYHNKGHAIFITSGSAVNVYYNTIIMNDETGSAYSSCIYATGGSSINIKNNILYNSQPNTQYSIFNNGGTLGQISNNDYYVTKGTNRFSNKTNYTEYTDPSTIPSNWISATADSNSKVISPAFKSDFHLQDVSTNYDLLGTTIIGYATDIDNDDRVKPYIGADEIKNCAVGDQITYGTNAWIGYVYKFTTTPTPGVDPTDPSPATPTTVPITNMTYLGRVEESRLFNRDVVQGVVTGVNPQLCETPTNYFFVRYKMKTTVAVTGIYNITVGGDDLYRLYLKAGSGASNKIIDKWSGQNYSQRAVNMTLTAGVEYSFDLEYYERTTDSRIQFSMGLIDGNNAGPYPFGDNLWNVYGFTTADSGANFSIPQGSYAGHYSVTPLNINTTSTFAIAESPSFNPATSGWQGAPVPQDYFTLVYKRRGFPCGSYQIQIANCDDRVRIFINDEEATGTPAYTSPQGNINDNEPVNAALNSPVTLGKNSTVEIRLKDYKGDARLALNFVKVQTIYDGTGNPTSDITISSNTTLNSDLTVCSCTVSPGATFTIPSGRTLTVDEDINVGANGKLLILDGGSLLQNSTSQTLFNGSNTSFELRRITPPVRRYDFTRWSVPVKNPAYTMHDLSPETLADKYYYYHPVDGWKINGNGTLPMEVGRGYSIRAPQTYAITGAGLPYEAKFTGVPNNGTIPYTVTTGLWNMIGNPYPSALNAREFVERNRAAGTDIGALYFWTHKSLPSDAVDGDAKYNYTSDDYAVWTLSGGIVTQSGAATPTGYIAAAQGFFISPTGSQIVFNNDMRIGGNNTQFFKTNETAVTEQNRVWLNLTNTQGAFKQILLGYMEGATNSIDKNYDAETISGNSYIDFYTISDALKLTIQARAVPFDETEVVTLGYKTTIAGDFTIAIDHADGLFDSQKVYLEDKTTGIITDLQTSNYTFTTKIGTFTDRFKLRYTSKTLGTDDFENLNDTVLISVNNKAVKVSSSKENIKDVTIYNIGGQEIFSKKKVAENELLISNLQASPQVLLVKITLENDYTITKKIVFH